jgi:threonylcarbamoyladenosine tRNA methylthiotransferase MtaB
MPQVDGRTIKTRAAQLRQKGETRVTAHLSKQIGQMHNILIEKPRMGRTEQFTEVLFDQDQPEGDIVCAKIAGQTKRQLLACNAYLSQTESS